jgi:phytanoyl-CoA hydroxylase
MQQELGPNQYLRELPWIDREDIDIDAFVRAYPQKVSFDLKERLHFWRENGYVVFEQVISKELIDSFLEEVRLIRENFHKYLISIEVRGQQTWSKAVSREAINSPGVKFNHLHVASAHAARLSLSKHVTEFLAAIFGAPPTPTQSLTFWLGSQQPTHIDFPYVSQQRRLAYMAASWIPLEDVHPDAGPLIYFPGAHKFQSFFDWGQGDIVCRSETRKKNGSDFALWLNRRLKDAGIEPAMFTPKKGDVLIWHCNMPHQGTPIKNPTLTRKSYVTHYTGLDDLPERWIPSTGQVRTVIRENGGIVHDFPWNQKKLESKLPSWLEHFG